MRNRWLVGVIGVGSLAASAWAAPGPQQVTPAEYRAQLGRLQEMVGQCGKSAEACDVAQVGRDLRVRDDGGEFEVRWEWLRGIVDQARQGKPADTVKRQELLAQAADRLETMTRESGGAAEVEKIDFAKAQGDRTSVLARPEFRRVEEVSAWDRLMAGFWRMVGRAFNRMAGAGERVAWVAPVLEFGFVLACAVGLMMWARRVMRRQRLAVALDRTVRPGEWEEVSRQWAETARRAAETGDWREAVHSLYWAAVVELEGRKVWRQHRGRTPREYVQMLEAGSRYYRPVAALTQSFERIWYGLRPAGEQDYARALALYEEVRAA